MTTRTEQLRLDQRDKTPDQIRLAQLKARLERIDLLIKRPVNKDRIVRLKAERKIRKAEAELLTLKAA